MQYKLSNRDVPFKVPAYDKLLKHVRDDHPEFIPTSTGLDLTELDVEERCYLVVATIHVTANRMYETVRIPAIELIPTHILQFLSAKLPGSITYLNNCNMHALLKQLYQLMESTEILVDLVEPDRAAAFMLRTDVIDMIAYTVHCPDVIVVRSRCIIRPQANFIYGVLEMLYQDMKAITG